MMNQLCKGRILVVDDENRYRDELEKTFGALGYAVASAQGDDEELLDSARRMVREFRPHVTIMDLRLLTSPPHEVILSGLKLIDEPDFSFTRCVVYSAYLGPSHFLARDLKDKPNVDDVVARQEVERLLSAVQKSFQRHCACRSSYEVRWPTAWNPLRITEALFGKGSAVPHDIILDVLGRLFPNGAKLRLSTLEGAASTNSVARGHSVLLQASMGRMPFVIKLAPRDRIVKEVSAYAQHIDERLGGTYHVQYRGHSTFWDVGAIHYSFIGSPQYPIPSLATFYRSEPDPAVILKPLRHFFEEVWRPHYTDSRRQLNESLFDAYDRSLNLGKRLRELRDEGPATLQGAPPDLPDPVKWVLHHEPDSGMFTSFEAVTHGDLHGDNLFVEGEHAWAIDFERSGPGPILRDFVELEQDIVTRLMPPDDNDLDEFFQFALALTTPRTAKESLRPESLRPPTEIRKAAVVVAGLREMASNVTGFKDMREYYWGLLLDSLMGSSLAHKDSLQRDRSQLLAAVISKRLEDWNEQWPPDWARRHRWGAPARPEPLQLPDEFDVFLSYNRKDLENVERLVGLLRDGGVSVWYDDELNPGENWLQELEEHLKRSKSCLICYGPSGLSGWQRLEKDQAVRNLVDRGLRVIPVLLPECEEADVLGGFTGVNQVCDLRKGVAGDSREFQKLLVVIRGAK